MNTPPVNFIGDHGYRIHKEADGRYSVERSLWHATRGTEWDCAKPWQTLATRFDHPDEAHQYAQSLLNWATQRFDDLIKEQGSA